MQRKQIHKQNLIYLSLVLIMIMPYWPSLASAAFNSGSTGADGPFEPTTSIALQIPESGVLNYTTVTIPTGVIVTFKKNSQNTPVTILATGDVTINGYINLDGSAGNYIIPGIGGPGGFDGGQGGAAYQIGRRGEGPGGGGGGSPCITNVGWSYSGGGGGFANNGNTVNRHGNCSPGDPGAGGYSYGNERMLPSIGGSGGGGAGGTTRFVGGAGGGGGGAILIVSSGSISVNGKITSDGGVGATPSNGQDYYSGGGGGSGGSIRLIANTIDGNGIITANGGKGGDPSAGSAGGIGSVGRIRFEASHVLRTASTSPTITLGYPDVIIPINIPRLTISSIGGVNSPAVPRGTFNTPDILLPFNTRNPVTIMVTGSNIPTGQTVTVKASPSVGNATSASATLEGTEASSSASLSLSIATAYPSIITASVTFQLAAANGAPIYAMGELVEKVRVSSALGGKSLVTYITVSGKEVLVM